MNVSRLRPLNVIGLNSGTSMDGIDAALFSITPRAQSNGDGTIPALDIKLVASRLEEFPSEFKRGLQRLVASGEASLQKVCLLNTALGEVFATACKKLIRSVPELDVHLIGSHGQTIWHAPNQSDLWSVLTTGTLQLGEPAILAARTGIPVVADFRPADMANGGQGAPLVSFADAVLFGSDRIATAVLNIGGIANLTAIDEHGVAFLAFDTGPGNVLIDRAMRRFYQKEFDADGQIGRSGVVDEKLLSQVLAQPYFKQLPPKTTGRELFGDTYADALIDSAVQTGMAPNDIVATLTAITARSIANGYRDFVSSNCKVSRLILGGGGADNSFLVDLIRKNWPHEIRILKHEECGISTKFKESLLFALLAYTTYHGIPNSVPACTGASKSVCLGKLSLP
ncbi:MAG TPA: anhydro-N-acetylmuramic acid kinase [Drouetiella sp.]